uniref:proteoglycan 4-like n=1 Tax=Ciona intestinalis TaxID=7719 RepID=UPI000EF45609|nr:proteoglycan 4-like [Ciona intestinalis]|eukprot:XP_026691853.1 proteoglycan 4-like [Ciona intestinalis]
MIKREKEIVYKPSEEVKQSPITRGIATLKMNIVGKPEETLPTVNVIVKPAESRVPQAATQTALTKRELAPSPSQLQPTTWTRKFNIDLDRPKSPSVSPVRSTGTGMTRDSQNIASQTLDSQRSATTQTAGKATQKNIPTQTTKTHQTTVTQTTKNVAEKRAMETQTPPPGDYKQTQTTLKTKTVSTSASPQGTSRNVQTDNPVMKPESVQKTKLVKDNQLLPVDQPSDKVHHYTEVVTTPKLKTNFFNNPTEIDLGIPTTLSNPSRRGETAVPPNSPAVTGTPPNLVDKHNPGPGKSQQPSTSTLTVETITQETKKTRKVWNPRTRKFDEIIIEDKQEQGVKTSPVPVTQKEIAKPKTIPPQLDLNKPTTPSKAEVEIVHTPTQQAHFFKDASELGTEKTLEPKPLQLRKDEFVPSHSPEIVRTPTKQASFFSEKQKDLMDSITKQTRDLINTEPKVSDDNVKTSVQIATTEVSTRQRTIQKGERTMKIEESKSTQRLWNPTTRQFQEVVVEKSAKDGVQFEKEPMDFRSNKPKREKSPLKQMTTEENTKQVEITKETTEESKRYWNPLTRRFKETKVRRETSQSPSRKQAVRDKTPTKPVKPEQTEPVEAKPTVEPITESPVSKTVVTKEKVDLEEDIKKLVTTEPIEVQPKPQPKMKMESTVVTTSETVTVKDGKTEKTQESKTTKRVWNPRTRKFDEIIIEDTRVTDVKPKPVEPKPTKPVEAKPTVEPITESPVSKTVVTKEKVDLEDNMKKFVTTEPIEVQPKPQPKMKMESTVVTTSETVTVKDGKTEKTQESKTTKRVWNPRTRKFDEIIIEDTRLTDVKPNR